MHTQFRFTVTFLYSFSTSREPTGRTWISMRKDPDLGFNIPKYNLSEDMSSKYSLCLRVWCCFDF